MSDGMVSEKYFNCPFVRNKNSTISLTSYAGTVKFPAKKVFFPTYITTFRSGPAYARSIAQGSIPVPANETYAEVLASQLGDTGHEFSLSKTELFDSYVRASGDPNYRPAGALVVAEGRNAVWWPRINGHTVDFDPSATSLFRTSDAELLKMGTDFIHDTQPLRSQADLLVSLAELISEGFPSLLGEAIIKPSLKKGRHQTIKALGGEYLNVVFGFGPMLSDAKSIYNTVQKIDTIVEQWIRDNGRPVRRRRRVTLPVEATNLSHSTLLGGNLGCVWYTPGATSSDPFTVGSQFGNPGSDGGKLTQTGQIIVDEDISFSSQFTYDLSKLRLSWGSNEVSDQNPDLRSYLGLHALGLSPTDLSFVTLWNLIPFSWLVDWFTNIGDLFDNFRAFQTAGLVCDYAYITSTATKKMFLTSQLFKPGYYDIAGTINARQKQVRRLKATPYGFDFKFQSLNNSQLGIMAALVSNKAL
jgi:hypothetical protein